MEVAAKLRLPSKGNIHDRIYPELTPYIIDPCTYIGDNRVQWLGIVAPTQSAKTVTLQIALADAIDQDPGPLLYILPDEKMGKKHLKEKIIDVIEVSPCLAERKTGKMRDLAKTGISLSNMNITPAWSHSLGSISSFPYKRVIIDEVRLMDLAVGNESNAIKLANDRLTTYFDMGIGQGYMVSSPSIEGDLLHSQLSVPGTLVLYWQVPCPHCGEYQELDFFKNIHFNKQKEKAECLCLYCRGEFSDEDKKVSWNGKGVYAIKGTKVYMDGSLEVPYTVHARMFFHWDSMVSPFRSFQRIWLEYIATKDKLHDYKNFIQCWLAKFWIDDISKTSAIVLSERKSSDYESRQVRKDTKLITVGLDTQDDGWYGVARGWFNSRQSYLLDAFFVSCRIDDANEQEVATVFQRDIISREYRDESGKQWRPAITAIDTGGHRTSMIYNVASSFAQLILVKGRNNQNATISFNKELNLYLVRTCEYLEETELKCQSKSDFSLPKDVSKDYTTQFCNVRKTQSTNKKTGVTSIEWKKVGQCDYRYAEVHAFICLDIPTARGTFRAELDKPNFLLNPCKIDADNLERKIAERDMVQTEKYDIPSFEW